jgi:hypothetical protein
MMRCIDRLDFNPFYDLKQGNRAQLRSVLRRMIERNQKHAVEYVSRLLHL